jgi:hypothetical protein
MQPAWHARAIERRRGARRAGGGREARGLLARNSRSVEVSDQGLKPRCARRRRRTVAALRASRKAPATGFLVPPPDALNQCAIAWSNVGSRLEDERRRRTNCTALRPNLGSVLRQSYTLSGAMGKWAFRWGRGSRERPLHPPYPSVSRRGRLLMDPAHRHLPHTVLCDDRADVRRKMSSCVQRGDCPCLGRYRSRWSNSRSCTTWTRTRASALDIWPRSKERHRGRSARAGPSCDHRIPKCGQISRN